VYASRIPSSTSIAEAVGEFSCIYFFTPMIIAFIEDRVSLSGYGLVAAIGWFGTSS